MKGQSKIFFFLGGPAFSLYSFVQRDNSISTCISHGARQDDVGCRVIKKKISTTGNAIPFLFFKEGEGSLLAVSLYLCKLT